MCLFVEGAFFLPVLAVPQLRDKASAPLAQAVFEPHRRRRLLCRLHSWNIWPAAFGLRFDAGQFPGWHGYL